MPTSSQARRKGVSDLHRLLMLMTTIRSRPDWTAQGLADHFNVDVRTIYRDLDKLKSAGFEVTFDRKEGGYRMGADCFLPPVQLTTDEVLALTVLCEDIAGRGQIAQLQPAYRALEKVEAQLPQELREQVWQVMDRVVIRTAPAAPPDSGADVHETMRHAIASGRAVRCEYDSRRKRTGEPFLFEPYALLFSLRAWYVIGRHGARREVRCLKLNRFTSAALTDRRYSIPEDFSVDAHLGNAWRLIPGERDHEVQIEFDAEFAENIAETRWHPTQKVELHDDGSATFRCTVSGLDEIVWWVLSMGPHARVVNPPELARRVRELAEGVAALYTRDGGPAAPPERTSNAPSPDNA